MKCSTFILLTEIKKTSEQLACWANFRYQCRHANHSCTVVMDRSHFRFSSRPEIKTSSGSEENKVVLNNYHLHQGGCVVICVCL